MVAETNYGIQGPTTANVIAVGHNAQAINYGGAVDEDLVISLRAAIASLQDAFSKLDLPAPAVKVLEHETTAMTELVESGKANPEKVHTFLTNVKDKLLMAGIVLADFVALAEPIKRIAESLKLPLSKFGL